MNKKSMVSVVSIGESSGIGVDVALLSWFRMREGSESSVPFVLLTDSDFLRSRAELLGISCDIQTIDESSLPDAAGIFGSSLPVIELSNELRGGPRSPSELDCAGILESIERGARLSFDGVAPLVTLPIDKSLLRKTGFVHTGHTDYLGYLSREWLGDDDDDIQKVFPVMMMSSSILRTVPVTVHIPFRSVPVALTTDTIVRTSRIVDDSLKRYFGISSPRLAFSGLNPHAGEGGNFGDEDSEIIEPAISILEGEGVCCIGPLSGDSMFSDSVRGSYDVAICMYHDQALIAPKTLAFDETVNVTLGLPFVRTSPDHGTAPDRAGTGDVSPKSFLCALELSQRMFTHATSHQKTSPNKKIPKK